MINQTLKYVTLKGSTVILAVALASALNACSNTPAKETFTPATEVITKTVTVPMQPAPHIEASFGYGSNPALQMAYQRYQKTGKAPNVTTDGFEGFAYDATQQIYIACEPLHLCTLLFQKGELIKDLSLGDTANWDVKPMFVGGTWPDGAELLVIKPKADHLTTNLVLTTDKRIYNIALLTSSKDYVRQAVFYYPTDTNQAIQNAVSQALSQQSQHSQSVITSANGTDVNLSQVNFNYKISGASPSWKPLRVFDDGTHTIIQFPSTVSSDELPVLFVLDNGKDELVNFRKKTESDGIVDFVVDRIFSQAVLLSGVGSDQVKVILTNQKRQHSWLSRLF